MARTVHEKTERAGTDLESSRQDPTFAASSSGPSQPRAGATATLVTMADQGEDGHSEVDPKTNNGRSFGTSSWNSWVRRHFSADRFRSRTSNSRMAGRGTSGEPGLTPSARAAATKTAVNNLDKRERSLGFVSMAFALALTAIVVIPFLTHHEKPSADTLKTLSAVHFFLAEGIVVSIFLLLGTLLRRRALLGFACLATGIWLVGLPALRVFGLAYLVLGVWLLLRGLKAQQSTSRAPRNATPSQPRPSRRSRAEAKDPGARSAPKPSKRYTPPKPTRRPPPKKPAPARSEPPK